MTYLKRLLTPLIAILLLFSFNSFADSHIRIHSGLSIDSGNLRLQISDRLISGHIYANRVTEHDHDSHRRQFFSTPSSISRHYSRGYINHQPTRLHHILNRNPPRSHYRQLPHQQSVYHPYHQPHYQDSDRRPDHHRIIIRDSRSHQRVHRNEHHNRQSFSLPSFRGSRESRQARHSQWD